MKRKTILVSLMMFVFWASAYASYDFSAVCPSGQTLYYKINSSNTAFVTYPASNTNNPWNGFTQPTGNVVVPASVTNNGVTYPVTTIGQYSFYGCTGVTSITLPSSVNSLGSGYAFSGCTNLASINMPNNLQTISQYTFNGCSSLTSVTIAPTVTSIDNNAFYGCTSLTSITLPNSLQTIGNNAFQNCSGLSDTLVIPASLTSAGQNVFAGCSSLPAVRFNATNCGQFGLSTNYTAASSAFNGCSSLTCVEIGEGVQIIPYCMFYGCTMIQQVPTLPSSLQTIRGYAFYNCYRMQGRLVLPNNMTAVYAHAFEYCSGLSGNLTIPNQITTIYDYSFNGCSGITSLTFPEGLNTIGERSFQDCSGLSDTLVIPASLTSAGQNVFAGCSSLPAVRFNATNCGQFGLSTNYTAASNAFSGCSSLTCVEIGAGVRTIPYSIFYGCTMIQNVPVLPSSLQTIGSYAFYNCYRMQGRLELPNSITSIGSNAFEWCQGLSGNLTIPNLITTINSRTFKDCSSLASLTLPSGLVTINESAFQNCSALSDTLVIPASLTSAGQNVFAGCSSLPAVRFNATNCGQFGLTTNYTAASNAFSGCSSLTYVEIGAGVRTIPYSIFYGCTMIQNVPVLPSSLQTIGAYAFYNCYRMQGRLVLPNSITSVGSSAFEWCQGLSGNLTIPNLITVINSKTFKNCSGLTSLTLPSGLVTINESAFQNCSALSDTLVIPASLTSAGQNVFAGCSSLPAVRFNATNCGQFGLTTNYTAANNAFSGCSSLTYVEIGAGVRTIPYSIFYGCTMIQNVPVLPSSLQTIGGYAFYNCYRMQGRLVLPNSITSVGSSAFEWCQGLSGNLTIPNLITTINSKSFKDCSGLTSLTLPSGLATIYESAFQNCSGLSDTLVIPASLTSAKQHVFAGCSSLPAVRFNATNCGQFGLTTNYTAASNAFSGCSSLMCVEIGAGVLTIPYSIFYGCNYVQRIRSRAATPPTVGNNAFNGISTSIPLEVPCGSESLYAAASTWSNFSNRVSIFPYVLSVVPQDPLCGSITIVQAPSCTSNTAVFSASSNYGYTFSHWSDNNSQNPRTMTITSDTYLTAIYTASVYTVTANSGNPSYGTVSGGGSYQHNSTATLTAIPNYGYHFTQWTDGSTQNPRTVTVTADATYTANFAPNNYTITAIANNATMGTVLGGNTYAYNTTATLTANANYGYHFVQWTDGNTQNPRTVTVTADATYTANFEPDTYTITAVANNATMGSVLGGNTYAYNTTATLTANANYGYHFVQWNDGNTQNPRTLTVTEDASYTATFAPNTYTVTVASNNTVMGTVSGSNTYLYNTMATLTATANQGYQFNNWNDGNTDNPRMLTVTRDSVFTAIFGLQTYQITAVSVDTVKGYVTGGGAYYINTTATLTAVPNYGYHFVQWNDGNTQNPRTVQVNNDATYTAIFAPNTYTITVVSNNPAMGSVTGGGTLDYNTTTVLTAIPNSGYQFNSWADGNTDNPRLVTVTGDALYTAQFGVITFTITANSQDATMGSVTGGGVYNQNSTATLTAVPNYGYHFTQWTDGSTQNPRIVSVTGNATYTAQFAPNSYTISASSEDNSMGSVTGGGTYDYNTTATLTAIPNAHHHFVQWADGNTDNPRVVTVTGDAIYKAHFSEDPSYTVTVVSGNPSMGSVSGGGTYYEGEQIMISASPAEHYVFNHWSDNSTDNPHAVTVTSNLSFTAYFSGMPYQVNVYSANPSFGSVSGGGTYEYGTSVTVTAIPNAGCSFLSWSNGSEENPYTFTVFGNVSLLANFSGVGIDDVEMDPIVVRTVGSRVEISGADGQPAALYDLTGRLVASTSDAATGLNASATGIYLLKIADNRTFKVLVTGF